MKLSISNIAWDIENDCYMYEFISQHGYEGVEIAPTHIFDTNPYEKIEEAKKYCNELQSKYALKISSMQSIWYGIDKNFFLSLEDREFLINYTKKAIDFASAINCGNLTFGCPKNRVIQDLSQIDIAISFFKTLGDYAKEKNTVLAIEANPPIYNTNFINTTAQAFGICKDVDSEGFKVNLDIGTMLYNEESLESVAENLQYINHIHISEPNLEIIKKREMHYEIKNLQYDKFVSIEMKNPGDINIVKDTVKYISQVFE